VSKTAAHLRPVPASATPVSDISEIRRSEEDASAIVQRPSVPALPSVASSGTCEMLASLAFDYASAGDDALARRAAGDAMLVIDTLLGDPGTWRASIDDQRVAAGAALTTGEAFLLVQEPHRAKACFTTAARVFDGLQDLRKAAEARVGLAKALLALHDPSARAVLEDAGELYEELGDEEAVRAIDFALRQANAEFGESPRSFHAEAPVSTRTWAPRE